MYTSKSFFENLADVYQSSSFEILFIIWFSHWISIIHWSISNVFFFNSGRITYQSVSFPRGKKLISWLPRLLWLPMISIDCHGLPMIANDCHRLLSISLLSDNEFKLFLIMFLVFIIKQNDKHVFDRWGKLLLRHQVTGDG